MITIEMINELPMVLGFFFIAPAVIAAIGLAVSAVGVGVSVYGQMKQQEAAEKAEALRKKQMELEAARRRREIAREAMRARAESLAAATAQGAASAGSSALGGAYGQIAGRAGLSMQAVNQNQQIGAGIFDANRELATGETWTAFGNSATNFGGQIMANAEEIHNTGKSYGLWG